MKSETIAIHGGYDVDPTTRAVAVPIYQTVAYAFDSADHGAALFNLEVEGFRYSRISNPTTEVLERRVAALEGGREALCVSTGQAALNYAALNVTELGSNIVSVPQLYGTTFTLFAHVLPSQGVTVRFAESDRPEAIATLIDDKTRAVFCESVGNPAGHGRRAVTPERLPPAPGHRDGRAAGRAPCGERPTRRRLSAPRSPRRVGQLCGVSRQSLSGTRAEISRRPRLLADDLRDQGRA